jgi:hypothetical protein
VKANNHSIGPKNPEPTKQRENPCICLAGRMRLEEKFLDAENINKRTFPDGKSGLSPTWSPF